VVKLYEDPDFIKLQDAIDMDLSEKVRERGCVHCGSKLHCGDYERKARKVDCWNKRYSFNCSVCRKRHTPPSVRFLGRRVYAGVIVVLAGAMMHGPSAQRLGILGETLGVDLRTLKRWRQWWLDVFVKSPFWKAGRGSFLPPVAEGSMPYCLYVSFGAMAHEGLSRLMRFLSPITVAGGLEGLAM